ncbi:methionine gamma-lyase family protein [Helicovermis profundi]|uniref:Methionine gamma-lyase family protein n=1 Tax=Helicovermis profundi TaxID=3065157 RepID=A0AAU9E3C0_9FIRM|nr:methionine gamma-lyase family protein [Clostridia bacterium S502]
MKLIDTMYEEMGIDLKVIELINSAEESIKKNFEKINTIAEYNQLKVLKAFQKNRLSDKHFNWNTGYGYDDIGRETLERVFSDIFNTEDAIVRPLIVNGTHALTLALTGILRPGDTMLSITGKPYDTLEDVIGISNKKGQGSLIEYGIKYKEVKLTDNGFFDKKNILNQIDNSTKMIYIQRSSGYSFRKALTIDEIKSIIIHIRNIKNDVIVMVDNCYGEFLDYKEPTDVGVDIMAGSLIKNPGGGLALSGGYIVGKKDLIELISFKLTSPGIGKECGLMFGQSRSIFQGLFMAPTVVSGALKGAVLCSKVYNDLGFKVSPMPDDNRSDIIQSIVLEDSSRVIEFCKGIQEASPVDSFVTPIPWDMPGYNSEVIMAAGAFVQGSSIELSADAPIKEPYIVYFQGGLTYEHSKFGVLKSLNALVNKNLITI